MVRWVVGLCIALASVFGKAHADCADVSNVTGWSYVDSHTIILYQYSKPIALLKVPWCYIYSTSRIRLLKTYMCSWDKILVDGTVCDVTEIKNL
ncbi:MAG: hypothetical protein KatS3mg038_3549 [Candidatus Kapaibacterium sp.]|nr:MAG: hypothetical protein KatS3mg038_3549 [Candidatus Kapabacteria bacterium]GIV57056.1 MAG: hypothetical protein KatS3mg040_1824 [Candidatus Kapabacteria bacterium]